jgi:protein phosphatase
MATTGLVRKANQDFAYAGEQLLAVADGFGERGATASQAAIDALQQVPVGDLLNAMGLGLIQQQVERTACRWG